MKTDKAQTSRPIIFSSSSIKSILSGKKTQTRRIVKGSRSKCPYGRVGDSLWIRETIYGDLEEKLSKNPPKGFIVGSSRLEDWGNYSYAATMEPYQEYSWVIGQPTEALELFNQALPIIREVGNRSGEATVLSNIGYIYLHIGQSTKALDFFDQALPITREVKDRFGEARTLSNMGMVYQNIGQPTEALEFFNQALPIIREVGNRSGEARILNNMGLAYQNIARPIEAINYLEQSATLILEMRRGLLREDRQAFLHSQRATAIALIDLLINQNQPDSAFEWVGRASTFELADYLRLLDAKVANPQAQQALDRWNQKNQQLNFLRQQLNEDFSAQKAQQVRDLEADINQSAETLIDQFPEVAELLEIVPEDIAKLQASIPTGTVVIQPFLMTNVNDVPNSIAIFILSRDKPASVKKVPIDPDKFDAAISKYREKLQDRHSTGLRTIGADLYDLLIRPVEAQIQALSPTRLAIIAPDKLRYIPFETLYDRATEQFLIEKYLISYLTRLSSRSLSLQQPKEESNRESLKILAFGNPVPRDPFALKAAEEEANNIARIFPESRVFIGNNATLAAFKQESLRFRFLHLATHGCFQTKGCCLRDAQECQQTRQVDMQSNTLLFADELFDLKNAALLNLQNTELLVLSACQTALQGNSTGEEIPGLAYIFERAGAKSVMATLWSIEDKSTQELMVQFYQGIDRGMSKGDALRQAKLTQIDRHPFYWSPFILIGNAQ